MKGIWVALWVIVWFAAILVAFFFIGAVVGIAAVIGGAVVSLLVGFRFIKRESTETGKSSSDSGAQTAGPAIAFGCTQAFCLGDRMAVR